MAQLAPIEQIKKVSSHAETVSIEPFVKIAEMVDELQAKVFSNTVFANPNFEIYPAEQDVELTIPEYEGMKAIVDPIVDWIIEMRQADEGAAIKPEDAVAFRHRIYREVIPMSVALAGRVIHDFDVPLEMKLAMPQTAVYVYFLDQIFDRGQGNNKLLEALAAALISASQRKAMGVNLPPQVSFDAIMERIGVGPELEAVLRKVNIDDAIIKPVTFQQRNGEGYTMQEIAEIKAAGSGYDITVWTSLCILFQAGVIKTDPRELLADPRFSKMLRVNGVMTRVTDDNGDMQHDWENGLINSSDIELQAEFNAAFFAYCGIDFAHLPEHSEENQEQYGQDMLRFYIDLANQIAQEIIDSGEELHPDKAITLKVMLRAAIICYENYIGDSKMVA